jgi:hypothetical protein
LVRCKAVEPFLLGRFSIRYGVQAALLFELHDLINQITPLNTTR